jgi:hypothetical protein
VRASKAGLTLPERFETVVMEGDLSVLSVPERLQYVRSYCGALGIDWRGRPFAYIVLQGKMVLYALRNCTDQLRRVRGISVIESTRSVEGDLTIVEVKVRDASGRTDTGTGAWPTGGLKGEAAVNAILKAETKAKRRATLSICGLGMLDESELDTIEDFGTVTPQGRVATVAKIPDAEQRYLDREKEGLEQLTPEQREIVKKRMADAEAKKNPPIDIPSQPANCLTYRYFAESETWRVDGPDELKKANRDLLAPLYSKVAEAIVCDAKQLGKLLHQLEQRKVSIREIGVAREPGE